VGAREQSPHYQKQKEGTMAKIKLLEYPCEGSDSRTLFALDTTFARLVININNNKKEGTMAKIKLQSAA
jgi:hypothetical protein